ncbi:hypothetical protein GALL_554490 [mine drainage metagenome]|uniref:Uncharacterized protein n=1 Tax=mine drainage metagenome TaxID=410659 RepID=A0A1J5NXT6_9ZZZZ
MLPRNKGGEHVQPGAKAQLCDVKAGRKPLRQTISRQKHMARFGKPIGNREIGVVEPRRDGDPPVAPIKFCLLVGCAHMP